MRNARWCSLAMVACLVVVTAVVATLIFYWVGLFDHALWHQLVAAFLAAVSLVVAVITWRCIPVPAKESGEPEALMDALTRDDSDSFQTVYREMREEQRHRRTVELVTLAFYGVLVAAVFTALRSRGPASMRPQLSVDESVGISIVILLAAVAMLIRLYISACEYEYASSRMQLAEHGLAFDRERTDAKKSIFQIEPPWIRNKWWGRGSAYALVIILTVSLYVFIWSGQDCVQQLVNWVLVFSAPLIAAAYCVIRLGRRWDAELNNIPGRLRRNAPGEVEGSGEG